MHLYRNMHSDLNSWSLYQILRQIQDRERKITGKRKENVRSTTVYIKEEIFIRVKTNKIKKAGKTIKKYIDRKKESMLSYASMKTKKSIRSHLSTRVTMVNT